LTELVSTKNPSVVVKVNEEKPGKGNFIVTVGTKQIVALRSMPRPFKALRELNFETLVDDIFKAL
jgi:hypothetical protein